MSNPCQRCGAEMVKGACPKCQLQPDPLPGDDEHATLRDELAWDDESPTIGGVSPVVGPPTTHRPTFDDYVLEEEIARGGMGVVFRARQLSLDRPVALKMVLSGALANPDEVQRFHTEAQAAASLNHPNIVSIYEVGEHHGQHFFSMELVEGSNLAQLVREHPFSPVRAAEITKQIAEAIDYAHQHGTLHRDLKPSNVLIDQSGEAHVTDFGIAKRLEVESGMTMTGAIMGTPGYMSPEQAEGKNRMVGPRSDIYSLGAILYELLSGRPPFQGASALETLQAVLDSEPVPLRLLVSRVPPDLEAICLKCLEKKSGDRYATAGALGSDLEAFLTGGPVQAESGATTRLLRLVKRETRHTEVMRQWSRAWMWHAGLTFALFLVTNIMLWRDVSKPAPFLALWAFGIAGLLGVAWHYRFRDGPPLIPIERQMGQMWFLFLGGFIAVGLLNHLLNLPIFKLMPVLVLQCGIAFGCMAAALGGEFYLAAGMCAVLSVVVVFLPDWGPVLFGATFAIGLLFPAWKYSRPDE